MLKALSFTSAGVDVANFQRIVTDYDESPGQQAGLAMVAFCNTSTSTSGATIVFQMALCKVDSSGTVSKVVARREGTATIGANRTGTDGASGDYLAPIVWDDSATRFFDLGGAGYAAGRKAGLGDGYEWRINIKSMSTGTVGTVTLYYDTHRQV